MSIHDLGLSTLIGRNNKDFSGKAIVDASTQSIFERLPDLPRAVVDKIGCR